MPRRGPATPWSRLHGLGSCAFARHYLRIDCRFLFLGVLRCFTSPGVASTGLFCSSGDTAPRGTVGFPIRKSTDRSVLAAPRGFSQLAASFIAIRCQGIRRVPVYAWPKAHASGDSRLRCNFLSTPRCAVVKDRSSSDGGGKPFCRRGFKDWWACLESDQGPRPYQGRALTS